MKPFKKERRQHARFHADIKARCFHVLSDGTAEKTAVKVTGFWGKDAELHAPQSRGTVRDVSFGGMYLESAKPFREGTILVIELSMPRQKKKVTVIGLLRWVRGLKEETALRHGLGIQFLYMQKNDWETLKQWLGEKKAAGIK